MIDTIARVVRAEGIPSAFRRAGERAGETLRDGVHLVCGAFTRPADTPILNVAASGIALRLGGVQAQLRTRLAEESALRKVALLCPGLLTLSAPVAHAKRVSPDFTNGIREAMAITGARTIQLDGLHDVPLEQALRLIKSGVDVILSSHDLALCSESAPHPLAIQLLTSARSLIFPSRFLLEHHRQFFSLPNLEGTVIEPGVPAFTSPVARGVRSGIAFAGSVKRDKGGHLLPELARLIDDAVLYVFGGGDPALLRAIRGVPNIRVHGYYPGGSLPSLLARHDIGLLVLPSIKPEGFSLVLSEAWQAGVPVAAFDLGAPAERIRLLGGGWLASPVSGASGLAQIVRDWRSGRIDTSTPETIPSSSDAARAHLALYRSLDVL